MKKALTYHVHGSYLYYLTQADIQFYLPVSDPQRTVFFGRTHNYDWGKNVIEVPIKEVHDLDLDCIIYQSNFSSSEPEKDYWREQREILSDKQLREVPQIFIEHDPPRDSPTDMAHIATADPRITIVHVTPFNQLMWDNGDNPNISIDHGVKISQAEYIGDKEKGIVVVNNLEKRGRRLGWDIFEKARESIPLDLYGMGTQEVPHKDLPELMSHYRFFFNPIRYTSLGLAVIEAMMTGVPVVGLPTTEYATVLRDGQTAFSSTEVDELIVRMAMLLKDLNLAREIGQRGREYAQERFNIGRFKQDWEKLIWSVS